MNRIKKITFIGGTGSSIIGKAAKEIENWKIRFLVALVDDGGANGRLREQLDIPPMGDIRKALISLSTMPNDFSRAFEYRFEKGDLKEHIMGNVFLAGMFLKYRDINRVTRQAQVILKTKGEVFTTTLDKTCLNVKYENGKIIKGENTLDENRDTSIGNPLKYFFSGKIKVNPLAKKTILDSSLIVLGPGDLGANTIAPILPKGIKKAIEETQAKVAYIGNLMTKTGETHDFSVNNCVGLIEGYLGKKIDYILLNNAAIPRDILDHYKKENERPMPFIKVELEKGTRKVLEDDLIDLTRHEKSKIDPLRRSLLRHDGQKVLKLLRKILNT
ncbi:MAG: uridine diphosphate-N-acetylglucosamine-binding protein YvcK [Patescibacteria group bacterium]|nr:uridine diphosphate-N-acetylglucosamine-binding protein YvcK [Patescibacteria group bacterium]